MKDEFFLPCLLFPMQKFKKLVVPGSCTNTIQTAVKCKQIIFITSANSELCYELVKAP